MWLNSVPTNFILQPNQVHVWKANVNTFKFRYPHFIALLSPDELERASKFKFEIDRLTYVIAKGLLRTLLGKYMNFHPSSIQFNYNKQAKPYLKHQIPIEFNVSHSQNFLMFGFTLHHAIGVDIEYNKRPVEVKQIAHQFFSKTEAEKLLALPENQWLPTFYNCWTRKEAFIKAKGGGLSIPLDQFEVSILNNEEPVLKAILWDQNDVVNWKMEAFHINRDYTGAILINCATSIFKYYNLSSLLIN